MAFLYLQSKSGLYKENVKEILRRMANPLLYFCVFPHQWMRNLVVNATLG